MKLLQTEQQEHLRNFLVDAAEHLVVHGNHALKTEAEYWAEELRPKRVRKTKKETA